MLIRPVLTRALMGRVVSCAVLAGVALAPVVSPAPASAASACVNHREFKAAKQGWTPKQVAGAFDTNGKRVTQALLSEVRRYPRCSGGAPVIVNYERKAEGKPLALTSKYW